MATKELLKLEIEKVDLPVLQCGGCSEYLLEDAVMERVDEILGRANAQAELEIIRFAA